jgi:hypothetical protein
LAADERTEKQMDIHEERVHIESIRRGFAEIESGHYIPHEAMKAWLLTLGSHHELPPPNCVCGEPHDAPNRQEGGTEGRAFRPAVLTRNRKKGL